jgi:hypothetical protein
MLTTENMKKEFEVLRDRPRICVLLNRDSVCAGDDVESHEKEIEIHSFLDPVALAREASSGYLPNVAGVGHSWICVLNDIKIAEIKTTGIEALVRESQFNDENRIKFVYKSATY